MNKTILATAIFMMMSLFTFAQSEIEGVWYNTEKDAKVKIVERAGQYVGEIVWLKEPIDEATGKPKTDKNNPDEKLQSVPVLGKLILEGFTYEGKGVYVGGTVYDPKNGKTYSCKMTLKDNNNLDVRGFVGFSLLGRTAKWTRAEK